MFPLNDSIPTKNTPHMTRLIVAVNALIFLWMLSLNAQQVLHLFQTWGLVPQDIYYSLKYGVEGDHSVWLTFITSMFLHGGWLHVIANLWVLWVFGDNVEDTLGSFRFLLFYLVCGIAGAALQVAVYPESDIPMIGASGAIAGVLAAYFLHYPHSRVTTLVFLLIVPLVFRIPAGVFVIFWILAQVLGGMTSVHGQALGGVAWYAHIGGFAAGLILIRLFAPPQRQNREQSWP